MSTTQSGFVVTSKTALVGTGVTAAPVALPADDNSANVLAAGGGASRVDAPNFNLATQTTFSSVAKNGCNVTTLSGTTPVNLDLTNLATNATSNAGDATFATWYVIIFSNQGNADVTVAPGGSNGARLLLAGTGPTLTIPANTTIAIASAAGLAVDSTHKIITVTPTSGGQLAMAVAGA